MAIVGRPSAGAFALALGVILTGAPTAHSQIKPGPTGGRQYWVITNRNWDHYVAAYGDPQWVDLEDLLTGKAPLSGAIRTRGILQVGPRPQNQDVASPNGRGSGSREPSAQGTNQARRPQGPSTETAMRRTYALTVPTDRASATVRRSLPVQPGVYIEADFEFEADALNLRELEVVGTFETPVGTDRGPSGFWFWAYAIDPSLSSRSSGTRLLAIQELILGVDRLVGRTVTVQGQFRGRNLFHDIDTVDAPVDGWVIKDGRFAVWVVGRKPRGDGWSLDPENAGDTSRWVMVTGTLEVKGGVTRLKAREVTLIARGRLRGADAGP